MHLAYLLHMAYLLHCHSASHPACISIVSTSDPSRCTTLNRMAELPRACQESGPVPYGLCMPYVCPVYALQESGAVGAYQWSADGNKWEKIGDVVAGQGAGGDCPHINPSMHHDQSSSQPGSCCTTAAAASLPHLQHPVPSPLTTITHQYHPSSAGISIVATPAYQHHRCVVPWSLSAIATPTQLHALSTAPPPSLLLHHPASCTAPPHSHLPPAMPGSDGMSTGKKMHNGVVCDLPYPDPSSLWP